MNLDFNDLKRNLKKNFSSLATIKVALLGDTATQLLSMAIKGMGYERGYHIDMFEADFNQVERQILDPNSQLYQFHADIVVVFQSTHKILSRYNQLAVDNQSLLAYERIQFIEMMCQAQNAKIIYYNYPEIDDDVFGSFANKIESSFLYQLRKLNYELMQLTVRFPNLYICDISAVQNKLGRDIMFQPSVYINTDMVLSIDVLPYIASRTLDILVSLQGKLKKCLILDLDNTLWGGVIGDDGLENIQIGHGLGIGKAFTEFQQWIKKLKNRGIILAICSKNTESVAKEPFENHPEMELRLDDIAIFVANWENKADNIRQIQQTLNIGFDSMVFLDDNPFERNMVRQHISGITVPELPEDPSDYLEYLYSLNLFETVSYSNEDLDRTLQYQMETKRSLIQKDFTNEADFLKSLDMVSEVRPFTKFNIPRVAQLSQRSNQFNLRTIRFTEGDIEYMSRDNHYECFTFTLEDKFGDNGLICVIILEKKSNKELFINTWFMSCRVLKREMENFELNTIVKYAREAGYETLIGEYIVSSKNSMVADHYTKLGFKSAFENDKMLYKLDIASYQERNCYITFANSNQI